MKRIGTAVIRIAGADIARLAWGALANRGVCWVSRSRNQGPDLANNGIPAHRPIEFGQGRDGTKGAQGVNLPEA